MISEQEVIDALVSWARASDWRVGTEVPIRGRTCDVYIIRTDGTTMAIEAKGSRSGPSDGLYQAMCYLIGADEVYIAKPPEQAKKTAEWLRAADQNARAPHPCGVLSALFGVCTIRRATRNTYVSKTSAETAVLNIASQEQHGLLPMKRFGEPWAGYGRGD
jgi:hypothetical protein